MRNLIGKMVMLSAYQSDKPLGVNMLAQVDLVKMLGRAGLSFTSATGCYNGVLEESVAVCITGQVQVDWLIGVAASFGQESILIRFTDGSCYLHFPANGAQEYIGQWTQISEGKAKRSLAYSKKGNTYYAAI